MTWLVSSRPVAHRDVKPDNGLYLLVPAERLCMLALLREAMGGERCRTK